MTKKNPARGSTGIGAFEWDEVKRRQTLERRGIDFVDVALILLDRVYEYRSDRNDETRFVAVGPMKDGTLIALVYTIRGEKIRIITARRAWPNEQRAYLHAVAAAPNEGAN